MKINDYNLRSFIIGLYYLKLENYYYNDLSIWKFVTENIYNLKFKNDELCNKFNSLLLEYPSNHKLQIVNNFIILVTDGKLHFFEWDINVMKIESFEDIEIFNKSTNINIINYYSNNNDAYINIKY
jgi:hypothetical protein